MNLQPAPPSCAQLFRAIRHMLVLKKLSDADGWPDKTYMVSNQELFVHFNPNPVERSRDIYGRKTYEGQEVWIFGTRDNLHRLIGVELLIPLSIVVGPRRGSSIEEMGSDWSLTEEANQLIHNLKQDTAIDEAVRARVRARAMEEQELM